MTSAHIEKLENYLRQGKRLLEEIRRDEIEKEQMPRLKIEEAKAEPLVTVKHAAAYLHSSEQSVKRWIREGKIATKNIGKKYLIPIDQLTNDKIGDKQN